ncbi:TonB-dependent receptor [Shewanella sp. Scap07]|uniref:TonB-dependent receptor n=1 Tax=Shewanella sp. Scap07 TaxID=2589987 RepID=UPI0015B98FE8|nr:TonB-dependent receptor [Shewanella sp. Scap07]QLE84659.1 TonB-dependent receptor [Shewanella sp. Scap07]
MRPSNFKKTLLATNIALLMSGAMSVSASAADAADAAVTADENIEKIEVRGIRASRKADINNKRFANAVVDTITAEDIGKFPDKNVADSLSRITGVGISREFGEGEKITIRGSGPSKNRTLLNGQNVATADWFILDNPSRGFNFTLLPSSLVKTLEVYKSPTADIDEGSIGGTVVMRTRKPLELDANSININLQGQYSDTSGETDPQLDALYSWKNESESFGFLISATKQDRTVQREGLEVLGWTPADENGMRAPKDIGNPIFKQDRERQTIFASLQYAPTDSLDFTLNVLDSQMEADNINSNLLIRPQNNLADLTDTSANGNDIYKGTVAAGGSYEWDFINRESKTETSSIDLEINYEADSFSVHAQLGRTEAEGGTYNETSWSFIPNVDAADSGYSFDLSGKPSVNIGVDPTNGALWSQNWTWGGNKPTTDEETFGQIDFEVPLELGAFTSIETGLKYRDHDRSQGRQAYSWHWQNINGDKPYMWDVFEQCPTLDTCGQTNGTQSVAGNVVSGNVVDQLEGDRDAFMKLGFGEGAEYAIHNNLAEIWDINEKTLGAYIKGNFEGDGFRGNLGVRVVKTEQTASSYNFSGDSWGLETVGSGEWETYLSPAYKEWVTEDRDYTEILPSFNIAFDLTSDQILRFAAARVMARPNYSDLAPIVSIGDLNGEFPVGTAGNPNLDPEIADQFDISWEWYFGDASVVSATYFFKDIKSYRTTGTYVDQFFNESQDEWVDVTISRPENGLGGTTDGLELGYQQSFGDFGIAGNYTYTNAKSDQERDPEQLGSGLVEGVSEHMANAQAFYENDVFGARLMYNYRTEWYKGVSWSGAELYNDAYGQLDFSSSYNITDNFKVTFEAVNLTDEQIVEYDGQKSRLMSIYQNGRRYVVGLNMSF